MYRTELAEATAHSSKSWEDATQQAVAQITAQGRLVRSVCVTQFRAQVGESQALEYHVTVQANCEAKAKV